MSIKLMNDVLECKTDTPAEKLLLLVVANYADDEGGNIFPSKRTLAAKTGLDERTVQRIVAKLVDASVLVVVQEGVQRPTVYRLDLSRMVRLETPRQHAGGRPKTPRHDATPPTGVDAEPPGVTPPTPGDRPPNPSMNHQEPPADQSIVAQGPDGDLSAEEIRVVPTWAVDWPVLHVKNGDYEVKEPYASCPEIRDGMIEWISRRLEDKKKGMPTAFAMQRDNCGWWDKYPLQAVVCAVTRAASRGWQGIIEDIAREWKPEPGSASSNKPSVQQHVQNMADTMETRQRMIREAAAKQNGQLQGAAPALEGGSHG